MCLHASRHVSGFVVFYKKQTPECDNMSLVKV